MTWTLVVVLAVGAFAFKSIGFFLLAGRSLPPVVDRCLALIPAALVAALVAKDTFSSGQHLAIDARVLGVGAALVLVWRRAPFVVVVVVAAMATALARRAGWN
ncbi:MAG: AzlD domain-containing protein [Acidimicrobiales bacterium]